MIALDLLGDDSPVASLELESRQEELLGKLTNEWCLN